MLGLAALLTALTACGGAEDPSSLVEIAPAAAEVWPGESMRFVASVAGTYGEPTDWAVVESDGGTIDSVGTYTAPETEGTYTVLASFKSIATTESTQVRVRRNIRVNVSPTSATVGPGESVVLSAAATGNVKAVSWSVAQGPEGGSVTTAGVYTAPQTPGSYEVIATSVADPSKAGTVTISVQESPPPPPPATVAVTLSPSAASITMGSTVPFTATVTGSSDIGVTWSVAQAAGGTVSTTGLYTAPFAAGTYTVVATSRADTSKTASATVTVTTVTTATTATTEPAPSPTGVVAAFPGAQGAGAVSKGGRGGVVYQVTTLNDSGTGSLRACVEASGPRTCVFRVGGTIQLASRLEIHNPYLTVAGQTAPGGGIQLSGKNLANAMLLVRTHDVTWRYTRLRKGYNSATPDQSGNVIGLLPGAYNVIFDHNSLAWTQDENVTIWATYDPPARSATFSWNIIAEPLKSHPTSIITGANARDRADRITDIDFHHNFVPNTSHRNPLIKTKSTRLVNNLFYNWSYYATQFGGGATSDVIGNVFRAGPLTPSSVREIQVFPAGNTTAATGAPSLYVAGNQGLSSLSPDADNWAMVWQVASENGSQVGALSTQYRRSTPMSPSGLAITADRASDLESRLLPTVGASQRLACEGGWVTTRDTTDARLVTDYQNRRGMVPTTEADVGGFPVIASGTPCADADRDGIPDAWETSRGLNPGDAADGRALSPSGYTHLELYLSGR